MLDLMTNLLGDVIGKENESDDFIVRYPVGSLVDHMSGTYVPGVYGNMILNAGTPYTTGVVGENNQFKTTLLDYIQLSNLDKYYPVANYLSYESEGSKDKASIANRASRFPRIMEGGIYKDPRIFVTDFKKMLANRYWDYRCEVGNKKTKLGAKLLIEVPILDSDGNAIKVPAPTFEGIDSFSRLEAEKVEEKYEGKEVGSKDLNMYHIDNGRFRDIIMRMMPGKNARQGFHSILTAHIGEEKNLDPNAHAQKIMAFLQQGKVVKGCPESFLFLTNNMWFCRNQKPFVDNNGIPLYGRGEAGNKDDKDLVEVTTLNLRGKSGQSGSPFVMVYSQAEGHQEHLTFLNYIRATNKYYGMDSNTSTLQLDIYPDVKFTRNSVRTKIDSDPMLRRALQITSDLCQIRNYHWRLGEHVMMSPLEIFQRVKERGYDWDEILGGTHSHWTPMGYEKYYETKELSTYDIIRMAMGNYKPYWMTREL